MTSSLGVAIPIRVYSFEYAPSNSEKYNIGDLVYVQVPQGNFDNVKYILGLAEIAPLNKEEEQTNANILSNYTKVGGNIIINKET